MESHSQALGSGLESGTSVVTWLQGSLFQSLDFEIVKEVLVTTGWAAPSPLGAALRSRIWSLLERDCKVKVNLTFMKENQYKNCNWGWDVTAGHLALGLRFPQAKTPPIGVAGGGALAPYSRDLKRGRSHLRSYKLGADDAPRRPAATHRQRSVVNFAPSATSIGG
ncbi:hypothetical protein CRG98_014364 [Punica granatum]|uniref:Uncharacterized protein n=1 Tax=Punica granatum TaxID=22663 RepID=A0A2I0K9J8_PUNGR|nr:hypothetical protein CRG98_014364 [Punica granatum]